MLPSAARAAKSSFPLPAASASFMAPAPAAASLIELKMPDGSAAATPTETNVGASRTSAHSSLLNASCLAIAKLLLEGCRGAASGGPRQADYCLTISTRRASASLPPAPTSTNTGGCSAMPASGTPADLRASRTAIARFLASSSFLATSPVLSV